MTTTKITCNGYAAVGKTPVPVYRRSGQESWDTRSTQIHILARYPQKPGQFIIAGFNGHGMPVIWLSARGLVKMLFADSKEDKLSFYETGIPRLYETSQFRIHRARNNKDEESDRLGTGQIFLATEPLREKQCLISKEQSRE